MPDRQPAPRTRPPAPRITLKSTLPGPWQQLDHWARVGLAVSMPHTAGRRRVEAALSGTVALSTLTSEQRAVFDAELDASISESARRTSFGAVLAGRGFTTVALSDDGVLTRHHPDGTVEQLP